MFLNVCKQTFPISHMHMSQKVKCVLMWNHQHIFIWRGKFWQIFNTFNCLFLIKICAYSHVTIMQMSANDYCTKVTLISMIYHTWSIIILYHSWIYLFEVLSRNLALCLVTKTKNVAQQISRVHKQICSHSYWKQTSETSSTGSTSIYLFKFSNNNNRIKHSMCSKLTIEH